jgi:hypothetical protein
MRFVSLVGCMVFIGVVDWLIIISLRFALKHFQRAFFKVIG